MASPCTPVRTQPIRLRAPWHQLFYVAIFTLLLCQSAKGHANPNKSSGLATARPKWSLGIQIGNYNVTGVSAQYFGVLGGSIDIATAIGLGNSDFGIAVDYVRYLGFGLRPMSINNFDSYNKVRDKVLPYIGAGLQIDDGLGIRVPMGVQYVLRNQPITLWGGIALYIGPFMSTRVFGSELWFSIGARMLI